MITLSVVWYQLDKHVFMAMDTHATMEELLKAMFSMQSMPRLQNTETDA
jgi:hypothetical protein